MCMTAPVNSLQKTACRAVTFRVQLMGHRPNGPHPFQFFPFSKFKKFSSPNFIDGFLSLRSFPEKYNHDIDFLNLRYILPISPPPLEFSRPKFIITELKSAINNLFYFPLMLDQFAHIATQLILLGWSVNVLKIQQFLVKRQY